MRASLSHVRMPSVRNILSIRLRVGFGSREAFLFFRYGSFEKRISSRLCERARATAHIILSGVRGYGSGLIGVRSNIRATEPGGSMDNVGE